MSEARPESDRGLSWPVAAVLTFLAAASVLVLEIAAGRLLAPYVGVSLTTYTGIIGAILAGIAVGAWLGGRAADAFGPRALLGPSFVLGGLAAIASVPIVGAVGAADLGDGFVRIVTLATVAFVVPGSGAVCGRPDDRPCNAYRSRRPAARPSAGSRRSGLPVRSPAHS